MPQGRNDQGKFVPGHSGNPGGMVSEERAKIGKIRRYAQRRSYAAVRKLETLMEDENGKVAATAALGILRVAGALGDAATDERIEREVERRLKLLIEEAEKAPRALAAVG